MQSMEDVVAEVVECYGCVDVLICNSSMKLKAPVQSVSLGLERNIMDINYFGPSTLAKGGDAHSCENMLLISFVWCWFFVTFLIEMLICPNNVAGVLPTMISRRSGHIVLVNSIQGRLAVPFRSSCELPIKSLQQRFSTKFKELVHLHHFTLHKRNVAIRGG